MSEPEGVAIVGMAGRFPGAQTPEAFFDMLCRGAEAVRRESDWPHLDEGPQRERPPFDGRAASVLDGIDQMDAAYFGLTPREAEVMDPQQRLFLECCAEALQRAGHDAGDGARVGVYAGMGVNTYFLDHVYPNARAMEGAGAFQAVASNEKDFLATQVAYRLGLTGPAIAVQTACSTSLVAVVLATEALMSHQCDAALAGGAAVKIDPSYGSFLEEGGIAAKDGHCRAFDSKASGTVSGSGVGVVLLKRLADALRDGDHVHAVIRGAALNNDGARKMGYAAPSVDGQAAVIAEAHAVAGVEPDDIGYIEAHGTGTQVGDPIEVAALTKVFRARTSRRGFCAIGSVKSNVGHADAAAGVLGLIKAALAVERARIPPTVHFESPNPALRLGESPFYVNRETIGWPAGKPRVAGVSAFGIGGTNAHVVLEEVPPRGAPARDDRPQTLVVSARTASALADSLARLRAHVEASPDDALPSLAWTLQVGRRRQAHRAAIAVRTREDALHALQADARRATRVSEAQELRVAFLFPGQGAQHVGMARRLYETEPTFRADVDASCERLGSLLGLDLRDILFPPPERRADAEAQLATTLCTQPALFVVEHALARLWMRWGVQPRALAGHSLGEYVAAVLAGVMTLDDALGLVATRARLLHEMPEGAMLAVALDEAPLRALLPSTLALAAVNAPDACVVSGAAADVDAFAGLLAHRGVACKRLRVQRAFHSALLDAALPRFEEAVRRITLRPPQIPVASNLTGRWLTAEQATDPSYWVRHLRETVRFADCAATLLAEEGLALLEVGPGRTLTSLAARRLAKPGARVLVASLPRPDERDADDALAARDALGRLWLAGARVDWRAVHAPASPRRVLAPTYPFERRRHWLPRARGAAAPDGPSAWTWRREGAETAGARPPQRVLLVGADDLSDALHARLRSDGHDVTRARDPHAIPADARPSWLVHVAPLDASDEAALAALRRALQDAPPDVTMVTRGAYDVLGDEPLRHAALAGAALAFAGARVVDAVGDVGPTLDAVAHAPRAVTAVRGRHTWAPREEPLRVGGGEHPTCALIGADTAAGALAARVLRRAGVQVLETSDERQATDVRLAIVATEGRPTKPEDHLDVLVRGRETLTRLAASGARIVTLTQAASPFAGALAGAAEATSRGAATHLACADWARASEADLLAALRAPPGARVVLPTVAERPPAREVAAAPAVDPLEAALVGIWEDLFGIQGIGVEDDFFELGGHSLLATRIVARVQEEFEVDVGLPAFFDARTVSQFARVLEQAMLARLEEMSEEETRRALER